MESSAPGKRRSFPDDEKRAIVTVRESWNRRGVKSEVKVLFDPFSFKKKDDSQNALWEEFPIGRFSPFPGAVPEAAQQTAAPGGKQRDPTDIVSAENVSADREGDPQR